MLPGLNAILKQQRRKAVYLREHAVGFSVFKSILYLFVIFFLHSLLMIHFEGLSWGDAIWLTLTTATTVGYGDLSAATSEGRWATALLIYCGGIFVLANFAGEYFEARNERKLQMIRGLWNWNMKNHIVIINTPANGGERFFQMLINQIRNDSHYHDIPIQLLSRQFPDGLPIELRNLGLVHYHGYPDDEKSFERVHIKQAKHIIVLAKDEHERLSDAINYDIAARLQEIGVEDSRVIIECVEDSNRKRFKQRGFRTVVRPVRAYPEVLVRALVAPGSEQMLEDLFTHEGIHPRRYAVNIHQLSWGEIVVRLMQAGIGTAVSYLDAQGEAITSPPPQTSVTSEALIIMVNADNLPSEQKIQQALSHAES